MSDLIDRQAAIEELKSYIVDPKKAISKNPDDVFQYNAGIRTAVGVIMELRTSSPWHRVEEPPTQEGKYLVCDELNNFYVVWWGPILGWCYDPKRFRYWMPIEPPEEDA